MFMNECMNQALVREHVVMYLTALGLPCRKKFKTEGLLRQLAKLLGKRNATVEFKMSDDEGERVVRVFDRKVFGVALKKLFMQDVRLQTGQTIPVPPLIHELCEFIMENVTEEGIFRKAGSTSKQNDIKSKIDGKTYLTTEELDVIDVAAILKYFLRELPDSLIPETYHKLFIACYDCSNNEDLILLAVLLLPIENLNLLTYLMHFFDDVTHHCLENKMTSGNIAICIAPNIFQVLHRQFSAEEFSKFTGITKILIEQAVHIGRITEDVRHLLNLEKGFNRPQDKAFTRILNNVARGINFMTC